jgi:hypothetical protein
MGGSSIRSHSPTQPPPASSSLATAPASSTSKTHLQGVSDSPAMCLLAWKPIAGGSPHKNGGVAVFGMGGWESISKFGLGLGIPFRHASRTGRSQRHSNISILFSDFYFDKGNVQRRRCIASIPKEKLGTMATQFPDVSQMG